MCYGYAGSCLYDVNFIVNKTDLELLVMRFGKVHVARVIWDES
jgi:hypothetical protein